MHLPPPGPFRFQDYGARPSFVIRVEVVVKHVTDDENPAHAWEVDGAESTAARPLRLVAPASPGDIDTALDAWLGVLKARGKKEGTARVYRATVKAAVKGNGWTKVTDLTYEAVMAYLGSMRESQGWRGSTFNRNLCVLRSFTKHLAKSGRIPKDPLVDAEQAADDGYDGARAATLEEARALIRQAWIQTMKDRRCRGNRPLYWLALFAAGCRGGEPAQWKRRHLLLHENPPCILWEQGINKNGKRQERAIAPELAALLRRELAEQDQERAAHRLPPYGPEDLVFQFVPPRPSFRRDRDEAGIPAKDRRGRGFSMHSGRKFFSTILTAQGVPEKMVDALMRHAGRVEARYYDPSLAEQAEALKRLPLLWAEPVVGVKNGDGSQNPESHSRPLDLRSDSGIVLPSHTDADSSSQHVERTREPVSGSVGVAIAGPSRAAGSSDEPPRGAVSVPRDAASSIHALFDPVMGRGGAQNSGAHLTADFLEALAALLRAQESGRGTGQRTGRSRAG